MSTETQEVTPAEAPEQTPADAAAEAAAWDAIEAQAAGMGASAPGATVAQPQSTTAEDLRGALMMLRMMAAPLFADWPDFGRVWSDQVLQATAESGGAVMDRHGWTMGGIMSQWGPYIALVAAVAPPGLATYQHLKLKRLEEERRAKEKAQREDVA